MSLRNGGLAIQINKKRSSKAMFWAGRGKIVSSLSEAKIYTNTSNCKNAMSQLANLGSEYMDSKKFTIKMITLN